MIKSSVSFALPPAEKMKCSPSLSTLEFSAMLEAWVDCKRRSENVQERTTFSALGSAATSPGIVSSDLNVRKRKRYRLFQESMREASPLPSSFDNIECYLEPPSDCKITTETLSGSKAKRSRLFFPMLSNEQGVSLVYGRIEDKKMSWPAISFQCPRLSRARAQLFCTSFSSIEYSSEELTVLICELFLEVTCSFLTCCDDSEFLKSMQLGLDQELNISLDNVQAFILTVKNRMLDNHYHNWKHVVDVAQVC